MEKITIVSCKTRRFADDDEKATELTLDFGGLSDDDIFSMAVDSAVIKWQAAARRAALKKNAPMPIPSKATYTVPKPGTRATGEVSTEKAVKTILRKAGGDVSKAMEMLKARAGQSDEAM